MTPINAFEQLNKFGWSNIFVILLLLIILAVFLLENLKKLPGLLGYETKASIKERKREEEIAKIKQDIAKNNQDIIDLQNSAATFKSDRIHDRAQSHEIQDQLTERIGTIADKQDEILEQVAALAEQTRQYELADIRETLIQAYRYYTSVVTNPMQAWTAMEAHAFWEQYNNYTTRGGNSYVQSTISPAMHKLNEIPMDDFERISELMESRHINK